MTNLSVNLNKVALIRNARGANLPNLIQVAKDCESFGAQGITVHPRPDERHIRFDDIPQLKEVVNTEFNIEGNPTAHFLEIVLANRPDQCTLVPDDPGQLTSDHGWDTIGKADFLKEVISRLQEAKIRVSIFVDPNEKMIEGAKEVGTDRIELYTGPYALEYSTNPAKAVESYSLAARKAKELGIGINAGHDLNLNNLQYFKNQVPDLMEVSIGQALISDALYFGLQNTIQMYRNKLI